MANETTNNQIPGNFLGYECTIHDGCVKNFVNNYCYNQRCVSFWAYSFEKLQSIYRYI